MELLRSLRNVLLASIGIVATLAVTLVGAAIAVAAKPKLSFWTSSEMVVAYALFFLVVLILALLGWQIVQSHRLREQLAAMLEQATVIRAAFTNTADDEAAIDAWIAEVHLAILPRAPIQAALFRSDTGEYRTAEVHNDPSESHRIGIERSQRPLVRFRSSHRAVAIRDPRAMTSYAAVSRSYVRASASISLSSVPGGPDA